MFGSRSARALSLTLGCALFVAPLPARAGWAPSQAEIERLYNEGDKKNSAGDFKGAAEAWGRLLVLLPEEGANKATRENLLLNILDAHMNAYHRMPDADGKKDIGNLREGKTTYDLYLKQFGAVYGSGKAISGAVQEKADALKAALAKAEEEEKSPSNPPPLDPGPDKPGPDKPEPKPIILPPENNGTGLIVGGAVTAALGFGAIGMLIAGAVGAPRAEQDFEQAQNEALSICGSFPNTCMGLSTEDQARIDDLERDLDEADKRGRTANALTIAGAVLAPVLLGAGAAMLAIGIKRNRSARSARSQLGMAPSAARGFGGLVVHGRF